MTSKRWLRMFGTRTVKVLFALCLLVSCLTYGAGDPGSLIRQLKGKSPDKQLDLLNEWAVDGTLDPDLVNKVADINEQLDSWGDDVTAKAIPKGWLAHQMEDCIAKLELRQQLNHPKISDDVVAKGKQIKSSPIYHDPGPKETANWLTRAFERLNNVRGPSCEPPNVNAPNAPHVGQWFGYTIIGILCAILLGFIVFAISRASWSKRLKRKAKALLDEDEPERTLDEWLERADKLEREGKYREAVRCLYLACLLKIDEARIARFERSQTNWEHLERIEASQTRPAGLEFREPTRAFDRIWYGMQVNGSEDVARFRSWYREITEAIRPREAA